MLHVFKRTQRFSQPLNEVFPFFQNPENLARITPAHLNFQLLTPSPIQMKAGAVIDYTVSPFLFPLRWTTLITEYDPPHKFVDLQLKGPYSLWHHTHTFRDVDGGTEMTDEVRYVMPLWILGDFIHTLLVQRQIEEIFEYRAKVIANLLNSQLAG
jgi:hypothetical protein